MPIWSGRICWPLKFYALHHYASNYSLLVLMTLCFACCQSFHWSKTFIFIINIKFILCPRHLKKRAPCLFCEIYHHKFPKLEIKPVHLQYSVYSKNVTSFGRVVFSYSAVSRPLTLTFHGHWASLGNLCLDWVSWKTISLPIYVQPTYSAQELLNIRLAQTLPTQGTNSHLGWVEWFISCSQRNSL